MMNDAYYALKVIKNLVSGFLINRFGFKQVYEADNFILSKGIVLLDKGCACDDMFKLNVISTSSANKVMDSACMFD